MLLVAVTVPLVASADSAQVWYLSGTTTSPVPPTGADYNMYKGDATQTAGTVSIANYTYKIWSADEAATVNVPFPAGDWQGLVTLSAGKSNAFDLEVGTLVGGTYTPYGRNMFTAGGTGVETFTIGSSEFTVPSGAYLIFVIYNRGTTLGVEVGQNYGWVKSPTTDPGYPIPELPTIILLATGLAFLAAYLGLKRRKRIIVRA